MTAADVVKVTVDTFVRFWCPGCDEPHVVPLNGSGGPVPAWDWNGSLSAPTISPSLKISGTQWPESSSFHKPTHNVAPGDAICCHSFIRNGQWEYLTDCTHHLAGQTVPIPPVDQWPI